MTVLLRKRVKKVPTAVTILAAAQIVIIAAIACWTCARGLVEAVRITGSLIIGSYSIWAICRVGRDAEEVIRVVKSSRMMKGCLMIEREVWS